MVKVVVPASTSNLGPGFDCLGLALKLYLTVRMEYAHNGHEIVAKGEGASEIPADSENLILATANRVFARTGTPLPSLKITIENQIPLSRGLGSSGSAVIAGLLSALHLSSLQLSNEEILDIANEIEGHPENAASALLGGLTINCVERGHVISKRVTADHDIKVVVAVPELTISTEEARKALPKTVSFQDAVFNLQRTALVTHAFVRGAYESLRSALRDKLHQPFRQDLIPGFDRIRSVGYENGALGVCISGSGSSVVGFTIEHEEALVRAWNDCLRELDLRGKVLALEIDNQGTRIERR